MADRLFFYGNSCEEVPDEDRLPGECMQDQFREHHGRSQESTLQEDKEEQHAESESSPL